MQRKLMIFFLCFVPLFALPMQAMDRIERLKQRQIKVQEVIKKTEEALLESDINEILKKHPEIQESPFTQLLIKNTQTLQISMDATIRLAKELIQCDEMLITELEKAMPQAPGGPKKSDEAKKVQAGKEQSKEKAQHTAPSSSSSKLQPKAQSKWTSKHDKIARFLETPTRKNIEDANAALTSNSIDTKATNENGLTLQAIAKNSAEFNQDFIKKNASDWEILILLLEPR
jgi:hypothetical protein